MVQQIPVNFPAALNRRAMLAWVALQDAPTPQETYIDTDVHGGTLWLTVKTLDELAAWASILGATYGTPYKSKNDSTTLHTAGAAINGWHCAIRAHVRSVSDPLDDVSRGQLEQLLDPPDGAA